MGKLPMCRICLVENVRMYVVVNKNLHELYEKLTDVPFVTKDSRPILACSFCCAKLKQCFRLMRKCLEAEELFTQMMDEDCELNPSTNHDPLEFCSGFRKCAVVHISIDDGCQTESIAVKEELPAVCETQDDIIEPKEEYQSDDLEPEHLDNPGPRIEDMLLHTSDSDSESDVPLMKFKTEVEEHKVEKQRAEETNRSFLGATITKKAKLDTQRSKQEDTIAAELEKNGQSNLKLIETTQNRTSRSDTYVKKPDHLTEHIGIHTGEKPYKCNVRQRSFTGSGDLKKHILKHTSEKNYKCDVCQRSFTSQSNLIIHIRIHTGEKPYKCNVCQRSFIRKSHLKTHIQIHTGEKPYKCNVCQHSFIRSGDLKRHIILKHTGEKLYKCDVCQRIFSRKYHLITHIRVHTGEKPYKCTVCQRSFIRNIDLRNHVRKHTGEKLYKCDVCQRSFTRNKDLRNHVRIHTGETPFKCNLCPRSFAFKGKLTRHNKVHTGEKPFK